MILSKCREIRTIVYLQIARGAWKRVQNTTRKGLVIPLALEFSRENVNYFY